MFQFPGFASPAYGFSRRYRRSGGLPHSEIHGSKPARGSPWLIATCCVLHRLSVPRHPPDALQTLDLIGAYPKGKTPSTFSERHAQGQTRTAAIFEKMHHDPTDEPPFPSIPASPKPLVPADHPVGSSLVTYPLHNVNRSRIGAPMMREHKPLPSRDTNTPLPGRVARSDEKGCGDGGTILYGPRLP